MNCPSSNRTQLWNKFRYEPLINGCVSRGLKTGGSLRLAEEALFGNLPCTRAADPSPNLTFCLKYSSTYKLST